MEVEVENVPSVGHTEEVPHDASGDIAEPLGSEPLPNVNGAEMSTIEPHSVNVKYLFCKYCPYKTRFVGNLTKHVRTHTGEKPFSCRHCGKRFASRSNLNYHEATHTGNKRFQCFISGCQFKTQLRESLNSHMRKIHGVLMQQNAAGGSTPTFVTSPDPMHSPPGPTPPGFPVLQPMSSMSNLPPIQDILTSPAGLATSLHSNFPPNIASPVDVKPSVAELAQYMIALHEGTTSNLGAKPDTGGGMRTRSGGPYNTALPIAGGLITEYSTAMKPGTADGLNTSPVTVETDTESNQDSPRVAPLTPQEFGSKSWEVGPTSSSTIQCSIPSIMPRLSVAHNSLATASTAMALKPPPPSSRLNLGDLANAAAAGAVASIEAPKSSTLSTELLKIFQNLGLDTMAILELLASQGRLHICHSCNIVFPEYSTFVLHRGCHGNDGPFQCHFCQHRFPEKFGFLTHFMQCPNK